MPLPAEVLDRTSKWIPWLRNAYHEEIPLKMHYGSQFDDHGDPQWTKEFSAWLQGVGPNSERRSRMTQALRQLRKKSIREYDVAYRIIISGESIEDTTEWLNARAIRNNKPERYTERDTTAIIVSAVDKLLAWWW